MKASEILNLPVMAMREGLEQGQVIDIVIDPEKKKVSHYVVRKGSRYDLLLIAATDIRGVGTGFLIVPDSSVVRRVFGDPKRMETVSRGFYLTDAQVISDEGIAMGGIVDYDFDPRTRVVGTIILQNGAQFPESQVVGLSGATVFVSGRPSASSGPGVPQPAAVPVFPKQDSQPRQIQQDRDEIVVTPAPSGSETSSADSGFVPQTPPVSAQVRNAYKPEPVVEERKTARKDQDAENGSRRMIKPPNVLRRLLVGKRLADDVTSADGVFTLTAGTLITEWHMQFAEQHDAVQLLMQHVEPG